MKKIVIKKQDVESIVAYAKKNLPNEACGLIAGTETEDARVILKVYYLTNLDASREHFSMDPKEQLMAVKDMRANGWKPLGNWHSHPETPSRPSEEDIRLAYDPKASYLILSLMEKDPVLNSFHVENGEVRKEILEYCSPGEREKGV
ncbi:MAG: M67 family metallopeptidase [Lachnospiraceae bacterium]|nr:M67 family metallopeptidase [Lachnospiraceae bacterium]